MHSSIRKAFVSTPFLKIISCVMGYALWAHMSDSHSVTIWAEVPLSFYNIPENTVINAPETIRVELKSKRSALAALDKSNLAIHINAQELSLGDNSCAINQNTLFLPPFISVNAYKPSNPVITVKKELLPEIKT